MKEFKKFYPLLLTFLLLILNTSCGHSEYYENGYKSGVSHGQSDVRDVKRVTDSSKYKYMSSSDFNADVAYEMMKRTNVWRLDDSHEAEFRNGFKDGYKKGVKEELAGNEEKSSNHESSHSSTHSKSDSDDSGITFLQWIIIIVITAPIITWLGFGKSENDSNSTSESRNKDSFLVKPWKSLLLVLFVFLFYFTMVGLYHLQVNNWSTYILDIMSIIALYSAYENAKNWKTYAGSSFLCGLVKILSTIFALMIICDFFINLYRRFLS